MLEPKHDFLFLARLVEIGLLFEQIVPDAQHTLTMIVGEKARPLFDPVMQRQVRTHRPADERFAKGHVPSRNARSPRQGRCDIAVVKVNHRRG